MSRRSLLACGLALCLSVSLAVACGPFFPWQLLDDRAATLKATPNNRFAWEAAHLLPPPDDHLAAAEMNEPWDDAAPEKARVKAEQEGLPPAQAALITRMRAADDAATADTAGAGLPAALRFYTAGAVAFRQDEAEQAAERFRAVLALPPADAALRATWAAFMRGRLQAADGDNEAAARSFAQTRALAAGGAPDPLGLAVASFGEEARLHLERARGLVAEGDLPAANRVPYADELAQAVALYAAQAVHASRGGVESLRMVAEDVLDIEKPQAALGKLQAAVTRPLVQRLLVAYALARIPEEDSTGPILQRLVAAIDRAGTRPPAADRLAALAYRIGRYDIAAQLVTGAPGPLAAWVRAKLALQNGDLAAAAAAYAEASRAFPEATLDDANRRLVAGEQATLTLARGQYVDALAQLLPVASTYWGDVVHIAERVLTVDELKQFVDAHVPAAAKPAARPDPDASDDDSHWLSPAPTAQLRDLLARRLMRAGRATEAFGYFHDKQDTLFGDPDAAAHARAYAQAVHDATAFWWRTDRARAWFAAAKLARQSGMDILGYEGGPDYFALRGDFATGIGTASLGNEYVSDGERVRFTASKPDPDLRFHYRFLAADAAVRAADLLPPRSQAFAAVLCQATGWMLDSEDKLDNDLPKPNAAEQRVQVLYKRYLREGAYVRWAVKFGQDCPEPDFDAAAHFTLTQAPRAARHLVSRYRWPIGGALLMASAAIVWRLHRRHQRAA